MYFYPLILILEIFCIYHAYKNNSEQKWYWLILLFPLIGCILYLYHHFYNRENVETISEGLKGAVNKNYQTSKLENKVNFSGSVKNKTLLADQYLATGEYQNAIELYESCLQGFDRDNVDTIQKLIKCYFKTSNYEKATEWAGQVKNNREFQSSEGHVCFAWSLFHLNKIEEAEENFEAMDSTFSNYPQRIEYAKFLYQIDKQDEAKNKLQELKDEYAQMTSYQRKHYRGLNRNIENTLASFNSGQE